MIIFGQNLPPKKPKIITSYVMWISYGITAEPQRNDSGANFQGNDSGFGPKSQSYRPKVGATDRKSELLLGRTPESEPNRPEKEPEMRLGVSTENPLKACLNPPTKSYDVLESLKQALLASSDVIISSQISGSKLQRVFTLVKGAYSVKCKP